MRKAIFGFFAICILFVLFYPKAIIPLPDAIDRYLGGLNFKVLHHTRKYLDSSFKDGMYHNKTSKVKLDVVIPIVEKDIETARYAIQSIRAMIFHPLNKIYLVAPESTNIRNFAKDMGCEYVPESLVIPNFTRAKTFGGWVFQQFIKLNCDSFTECDDILVVDADTIFLRPQVFINDRKGTYTFNVHSDYDLARKKFTKKLLGLSAHFRLDFVAHHMIINRNYLRALREKIEKIHHKSWADAIMDMVVTDSKVGFSEYDIYATFVCHEFPRKSKVYSSANTMIYRDRFDHLQSYIPVYAQDYKSVSSHSFMKLEHK